MKANVGGFDRILRALVGLALLGPLTGALTGALLPKTHKRLPKPSHHAVPRCAAAFQRLI